MVLTLVATFVVLLLLGLPISYVLAGAGLAAVLAHGNLAARFERPHVEEEHLRASPQRDEQGRAVW